MINDITVWAEIRAHLAVLARTLTPSPLTNPVASIMISRSRAVIWLPVSLQVMHSPFEDTASDAAHSQRQCLHRLTLCDFHVTVIDRKVCHLPALL